jgi:O-antigen/teichoic acid export membrane protein
MNFISSFIHRRIGQRPNLVKIVHNISWLFFDKILRMGVGFFVGVWIVRYLGPEQFGLLSFATAFAGLFGAFATLGLQGIVVRDIVHNPDCAPETLGTAAILQLIGGTAAYLIFLVAIAYIRPEDSIARTIVAILGSTMLLKASEISVYWFESKLLSKYTVWVQNGVFLVFAAVKVILILEQASLIAFVWIMLAEAVVVAIILLAVLNKYGLLLTKLRVSTKRAKLLLKDSWPLLLSGISITIYMQIDKIMLGKMVGYEEVGIYSVATLISTVWYFLIPIFLATLFPSLTNLHAQRSGLLSQRWIQLYTLMFWFSVVVALILSIFSNILVEFIFGEMYTRSASVLVIHVCAGVNVAIGSVWSQWLLLENKLKIGLYSQLLGMIINVGLNFWLIPSFGAIGAALATLLSYWISAFFGFSLYKPKETFGYIARAIFLKKIWN